MWDFHTLDIASESSWMCVHFTLHVMLKTVGILYLTLMRLFFWIPLSLSLVFCDGAGLQNGSFESPAGISPGSYLILPVGDFRLSHWSIVGTNAAGTIALHNGLEGTLDFPAVDGDYQLVFNAGNHPGGLSIRQVFDTIPGNQYTLAFNLARLGDGLGDVSLDAALRSDTGVLLGHLLARPPAHGYGPSQELPFTATTARTHLEFYDSSAETISVDVALDNIRLLPSGANADILFGPVVNPANGHLYYLLRQNTWTSSQAKAIELGGNLVTINDPEEQQWLFNTFSGTNRNLWLGLYRTDPQGSFRWVSGEAPAFTNWADGEPSSNEQFVHMVLPGYTHSGRWNNLNDVSSFLSNGVEVPLNGVVETLPSEPSLSIAVKTVEVTMHLTAGRTYQLEASSDLSIWKSVGSLFLASAREVIKDFKLNQARQYFRVQGID
jgi:hypothetical protein